MFFPDKKFAEVTAIIKTRDGVRLKVFPNDLIGRYLYLTGDYERSVLDVLYRLAEPGDVLLDIGANIGYVSACFLHMVQNARVIAVEPQPRVLDLLKENLSQFGKRGQLFPVAMSDKVGSANFAIDHQNLGNGRIVDFKTGLSVPLLPGDDLLKFVDRINLVKIDVQGHEEKVLRSLTRTLSRLRPRAILFEDDSNSLESITSLLAEIGYQVRGIQKTILGFKICQCGRGRQDNYIAIPSDAAVLAE